MAKKLKFRKVESRLLFYDTNALLALQDLAFKNPFYCSSVTLRELENIKTSAKKDMTVKYKARKISHLLDRQENYTVINSKNSQVLQVLDYFGLEDTPDNRILADAHLLRNKLSVEGQREDVIFVSNDISCKNIAKNVLGLHVESVSSEVEDYKGYIEIRPTEEELANIYQNTTVNTYGLLTNQYMLVRDKDDGLVDTVRWTGSEYKGLNYSNLNNRQIGKVKPRNTEQCMAMDLLQNQDIPVKVLTGKYGVGKDFLMISHAFDLMEKGKIDKIVWVRNTVGVKDAKEIGFLPGWKTAPLYSNI